MFFPITVTLLDLLRRAFLWLLFGDLIILTATLLLVSHFAPSFLLKQSVS
jgi:hypothetical protein